MHVLRTIVIASLTVALASSAHAQPGDPSPSVPATAPAGQAVLPSVAPTPAARAEYRDNVITFSDEEWMAISVNGYAGTATAGLHRDLHARLGERREDIDGERFYRLVGRPDLADSYRVRRRVRLAGLIAGGVGTLVIVVGMADLLTAPTVSCDVHGPSFSQCLDEQEAAEERTLVRGATVAAVGLGVAAVGVIVRLAVARDPVDNDTRRGLAAAYNRRLRERLGFPEPLEIHVDPYATASGGGLTIGGQF